MEFSKVHMESNAATQNLFTQDMNNDSHADIVALQDGTIWWYYRESDSDTSYSSASYSSCSSGALVFEEDSKWIIGCLSSGTFSKLQAESDGLSRPGSVLSYDTALAAIIPVSGFNSWIDFIGSQSNGWLVNLRQTNSNHITKRNGRITEDVTEVLEVVGLDNDSSEDLLVVSNTNIGWVKNQQFGNSVANIAAGRWAASTDINADAHNDVIIGHSTGSLTWHENIGGAGNFDETGLEIDSDLVAVGGVAVGDINGDGRNDVVAVVRIDAEDADWQLVWYQNGALLTSPSTF